MRLLRALCFLIPCLAWADYAQPGPFGWSVSSNAVTSAGTAYTFDLYVPDGGGPFPVVAIGHGFDMKAADMAGYGRLLASRGNVVAIPNFGALNANHAANAQVMLASIDEVVSWSDAGFPLAGMVDGARQVVMGHSAGGLSAFLAGASRPGVRAVVLLDAVDTNLGGPAAPEVQAPVLFLFTEPTACNNDDNSEPWYAAVASTSKAQMRVVGATHCDPQAPIDPLCAFGCPGADAGLTPYFERYAVGWTQYFVACDPAARAAVDGTDFQNDADAGGLADYAFVGIALPAACSSGNVDAGNTSPDAGPSDAGVVAGADAGPLPSPDAGRGVADGGSPAPGGAASCGCGSGHAVMAALVVLLAALVRPRRAGAAHA